MATATGVPVSGGRGVRYVTLIQELSLPQIVPLTAAPLGASAPWPQEKGSWMKRQRCFGVVSLVAGLSLFGLASARAQDATQGGYYPPPADPNAPPPGAYAGAPPPAAPPGAYPQPAPMPPPPYNPFLALGFLGVHSIQNSNSGTGP